MTAAFKRNILRTAFAEKDSSTVHQATDARRECLKTLEILLHLGMIQMKVVSVINYKGGVGKTTLSVNLAAGIAARGKNVLIMDADLRMSLAHAFAHKNDWLNWMDQKKTIMGFWIIICNEKIFRILAVILFNLKGSTNYCN